MTLDEYKDRIKKELSEIVSDGVAMLIFGWLLGILTGVMFCIAAHGGAS